VLTYLLARERLTSHTIEKAVERVIRRMKGGYSILVMSPRKIVAARDPLGYRPLSLGKINGSYVFASETVAFDAVGAEFIRDVEPGEIITVSEEGMTSNNGLCAGKSALCIFEHIYFARPDSILEGQSVYEARKAAGKCLARQHPVEADLVIGVPDSGLCAAIGYSEESGIPYGEGLIKNRYIGRTFIQPSQAMRNKSVGIKLNVLKAAVNGKRIVVVDDSIVRGTTCANFLSALRNGGAREIHMRISSPPFLWPCYFGTDIPDRRELAAYKHSIDEIREMIGADSLGFLSVDSLGELVPGREKGFCKACFTGEYDMEIGS